MRADLDLTQSSIVEEATPVAVLTATIKEKIAERKTIVYQTLIDPTVVRIEGEKAKSKLFRRFLFKLNTPEEIQFSYIEKYYEPFIVVSGKYLIDYYRKCVYSVKVNKEAKEVILLEHTFRPAQNFSSDAESIISLKGEERLVKETRNFLILNRYGQDSKLNEFPSAPSEDNPQKLIKSYKMPEVAPDIDLEVIRKRITQRPNDISRIVDEELEIDERSVIYAPRFKVTYRCPRIGKEDYLEFDGVTLKQIKHRENSLSAINMIASLPRGLLEAIRKWITTKLRLR